MKTKKAKSLGDKLEIKEINSSTKSVDHTPKFEGIKCNIIPKNNVIKDKLDLQEKKGEHNGRNYKFYVINSNNSALDKENTMLFLKNIGLESIISFHQKNEYNDEIYENGKYNEIHLYEGWRSKEQTERLKKAINIYNQINEHKTFEEKVKEVKNKLSEEINLGPREMNQEQTLYQRFTRWIQGLYG